MPGWGCGLAAFWNGIIRVGLSGGLLAGGSLQGMHGAAWPRMPHRAVLWRSVAVCTLTSVAVSGASLDTHVHQAPPPPCTCVCTHSHAGPTALRGLDSRIIEALTDNPQLLRAMMQRATRRMSPGGGSEGDGGEEEEEDDDEGGEVSCRVA